MIVAAWDTTCLLAPWLLLGAFLAGLLHVALPAEWLRRRLRGWPGIFKAVALGVPLPLCSCGVIPAGVGLKKNGASDGAALGFLISTPQTGVDSILVSASFFGWPFALFKMVLAAVTGVAGGVLAVDTSPVTDIEPTSCTPHRAGDRGTVSRLGRLGRHALEVIHSIWIWLAVGILISAAISVWLVPSAWFQAPVGYGLVPGMLLMLLISLPMYVCATASVPIAAALVAGGVPAGAALVFLIAGPATNVATIGAIYGQFGTRNTLVYLATIILGSMLGALVFDGLFGTATISAVIDHHEHIGWFSRFCGVLLLGMFLWFIYLGWQRRALRRRARLPGGETFSISLPVSGMHCQNCVDRIESALLRHREVRQVQVDLAGGKVLVAGDIGADTVRQTIEAAGFPVGPDASQAGSGSH